MNSQKHINLIKIEYSAQTDGDYIISSKEHNALIIKFNDKIK